MRNHFNDSFAFGSDQGFMLAFGMVGYDASSEGASSEAYGQVKLYHRVWGQKDESTDTLIDTYLEEIPTEPCQKSFFPRKGEEPNDQHRFYTLDEKHNFDVDRNMENLRCPKGELKIMGDYDSAAGESLLVAFERCEGKPICESRENIDRWLQRKFILTVQNQEIFKKSVIDESSRLTKLASIKWHIVSPQMRTEYSHSVRITKLNLAD